jgi:hypothetical protein
MALRDWIQNSRQVATPATTATADGEIGQVVATVATVATEQRIGNDIDASADPATERRRAKALALLQANPGWQRAMILEAGRPPILAVAIRGVSYGEMELPADYDPALLLALIEQHGNTVH